MRILCTGGTGFLGKHVQEAFKNSEHEVWFPNRRKLHLGDQNCVWDVCEYAPDVILHMAALCGGILANQNSPADFLHENVDMGSHIYSCAKVLKKSGVDVKVYSLGSVCAYPKFCPVPFKEDDLWNGYPEETNAPYGMSKRLLLMLSQTYRQQYQIGGAHLIPVNLYGEYDHFDPTNSHVIPALIRKVHNAIQNNLPTVECWGTGEATREFLYAGDAAEAIVKAIDTGLDTDLPINLGTGTDISIKDLIILISTLMEYKGQIVFTGEVSDGQPKRVLDVSRAKKLLGWKANTSFLEGLLRTISWYRQNSDAS
jgi:GDP-L-fucose synthase